MAFPFSFWKLTPGGGGSAPVFVSEIQRTEQTNDDATIVLTAASTLAAGTRAVMVHLCETYMTPPTVMDSEGNAWAADKTGAVNNVQYAIYSAHVANAVASGSGTITITTDGVYGRRTCALFSLNNVASSSAVDVTADVSSFGNTVSNPVTTNAATCVVGFVTTDGASYTVAGGFTGSGAVHSYGGLINATYLYLNAGGPGPKDPSGTVATTTGWGSALVAYR